MTFQNIPDIYYRIFYCEECGYQAQVAGERFFDESCQNFMDTFHCLNCNVIHESLVSEIYAGITRPEYIDMQEIFPDFDINITNVLESVPSLENIVFCKHEAIEQVSCYSCDSTNNIKWSKENPYCPKCKQLMKMRIKNHRSKY